MRCKARGSIFARAEVPLWEFSMLQSFPEICTQPGERALLAADAGLDAAFALTRSLALQLGLRVVVPVTRYHFILEGSDRALFDQSAVAGVARVGFELRFGRP